MTLWHNPDIDLPRTDNDVLCIISGRIKNVVYEKAFVIGAYCSYPKGQEGWVFDTITKGNDEEDYDKLTCHCWTELPRVPSGLKEKED